MHKRKFRVFLDLIPLIILVLFASILIYKVAIHQYNFQWQHIVMLSLLPINIALVGLHHHVAVIFLGFTLLLGVAGLLAVTPAVTITTFYAGPVPVFYGQLFFWALYVIHLIVSGRYYFGIGTKKYWQTLFSGHLRD